MAEDQHQFGQGEFGATEFGPPSLGPLDFVPHDDIPNRDLRSLLWRAQNAGFCPPTPVTGPLDYVPQDDLPLRDLRASIWQRHNEGFCPPTPVTGPLDYVPQDDLPLRELRARLYYWQRINSDQYFPIPDAAVVAGGGGGILHSSLGRIALGLFPLGYVDEFVSTGPLDFIPQDDLPGRLPPFPYWQRISNDQFFPLPASVPTGPLDFIPQDQPPVRLRPFHYWQRVANDQFFPLPATEPLGPLDFFPQDDIPRKHRPYHQQQETLDENWLWLEPLAPPLSWLPEDQILSVRTRWLLAQARRMAAWNSEAASATSPPGGNIFSVPIVGRTGFKRPTNDLVSLLNIRRETTELRAKDPIVSKALDHIQIYANKTDERFRELPVQFDDAGNVTIDGNTVRFSGAGLVLAMVLGKLGLGVQGSIAVSGTGIAHFAGNTIRLVDSLRTPATSSDPGNPGEVCIDANYLYVCIATNTWRRIALSIF